MSDTWDLSWTSTDGTEINVENPGEYTIVSAERSLPGQFEQTQNTTESGSWLEPPQVCQEGDRSVVTIVATHGRFEIEIDGLSIEVQSDDGMPPPPVMPLMMPMMPLTSMPPSPIGGMAAEPVTDRQTTAPHPSTAATTCTQCGHLGQPDDRFCAHCGTPL
jgi:zinc-ribbon domain